MVEVVVDRLHSGVEEEVQATEDAVLVSSECTGDDITHNFFKRQSQNLHSFQWQQADGHSPFCLSARLNMTAWALKISSSTSLQISRLFPFYPQESLASLVYSDPPHS